MGARLLILVVLAGGLAVYFAFAKKPTQVVEEEETPTYLMPADNVDGGLEAVRTKQILVAEQPIGGREPKEEPEIDVQVEVDTSGGKNRLYFTISEAHGYYVDTFQLRAWWVEEGVTSPEDSPLSLGVYLNTYKKANETLRTCVEVVPAELDKVGGDIGTTKNWDVILESYGRAREKNPDKLPIISEVGQCH
jgi:hypothetical protein